MKILNWKKEKTLYRYIKDGDLFCFTIAENLFGYGRIIAKNKLGATAEFFDFFTSNPTGQFDYSHVNDYPVLFKSVLDCHTLFEAKLESDWRIIGQDPGYQNPNPTEITSINLALGVAHNADFSIVQEIDETEGKKKLAEKIELRETPRSHYHILSLLIRYKPEIFDKSAQSFGEFADFIQDEFQKIHPEK